VDELGHETSALGAHGTDGSREGESAVIHQLSEEVSGERCPSAEIETPMADVDGHGYHMPEESSKEGHADATTHASHGGIDHLAQAHAARALRRSAARGRP
jgi:hypothetical protein